MSAKYQGSIAVVYDVAYPFVEGGGQRRMFEIARRFAEDGWEVHWYSLKTWDGDAIQERSGIRFYGLSGHTEFFLADGTRSRRAALSFGAAIFRANVRFSDYDVVWCGQWPYFHILALIARLVPWRAQLLVDWWEVWGRHWSDYIGGSTGLMGRTLEWLIANFITRAGHAVLISSRGIEEMLALGADRRNITLIPNGVNTAEFATAPAAVGAVDITSFGRIKDHKNVDHLVRAIALLKARGRHYTADIIGDGPELEKIKVLTSELNVGDQIEFHGRVDDTRLIGLLKRARIFVHSSTKEAGGSITMLEANACGRPIVCYRHPLGIDPSLILDRRTGLLVDDVSPEGLADGIEEMLRLLADGDLAAECLAHARDFDWDVIALRYRRLVTDLLGSRGK